MVVNPFGAIVAAGFSVQLGHVVDIGLSEAAGIIDGGNLCRYWGEACVFAAAGLVAVLRGLALGVISGVTFHGWIYGWD